MLQELKTGVVGPRHLHLPHVNRTACRKVLSNEPFSWEVMIKWSKHFPKQHESGGWWGRETERRAVIPKSQDCPDKRWNVTRQKSAMRDLIRKGVFFSCKVYKHLTTCKCFACCDYSNPASQRVCRAIADTQRPCPTRSNHLRTSYLFPMT